ncbi:Fic family protein [Haloferula sp.]|uniref:Fic family protein n=1 Tax=Haloferula sp. TaxID=2497595 RepID=UPI003C73C8DB
MEWNWQRQDWPNFRFDLAATESLEKQFLLQSGKLLGASCHLSDEDQDQIRVQLLSDEALLTSRIEGEILDRASLQSSLQRQLGLSADSRRVSPAERGVSELVVDGYRGFDQELTLERILKWHRLLMQGRGDIEVGAFRSGGDPMRIVSGPIHDPRVHYEAPPAADVIREMQGFMNWWNGVGRSLPCLARASVAHLYFESIHPFEDGNGRIGRALSELAVSQSIGKPVILSLSRVIDSKRTAYYDALARGSRTLVIDDWVAYFSKALLEAQVLSLRSVEFLIGKARFFDRLDRQINARQEKALLRMFREGVDGFQGGLSASNYRAITKAGTATTTRDLAALVEIGALRRTGERKHARYHLNLSAPSSD